MTITRDRRVDSNEQRPAPGILGALKKTLEGLRPDDVEDLARRGRRARELVYSAPLPADLQQEILGAYRLLQQEYGPTLTLAVRSSATAEDLPDVSFAGAHETYLNVEGDEHLIIREDDVLAVLE